MYQLSMTFFFGIINDLLSFLGTKAKVTKEEKGKK